QKLPPSQHPISFVIPSFLLLFPSTVPRFLSFSSPPFHPVPLGCLSPTRDRRPRISPVCARFLSLSLSLFVLFSFSSSIFFSLLLHLPLSLLCRAPRAPEH